MIRRVLSTVLTGLTLLVSTPGFPEDSSLPLQVQQKSQADDFSGYPYSIRVDGATLTLADNNEITKKDKAHPSFYFVDLSGRGTRNNGLLRKDPYSKKMHSGIALTFSLMKDIKVVDNKGVQMFYVPLKTFNIEKPADYKGDDVEDVRNLIRQARDFRESKEYSAAVSSSTSRHLPSIYDLLKDYKKRP